MALLMALRETVRAAALVLLVGACAAPTALAGAFDDLGKAVESGAATKEGASGGAKDGAPDGARSGTGALDAFLAKQAAADAASDALPLTARIALFVEREASVLGDYDPHGGSTFKQSEKVFLYVEPLGLVFKDKKGLLNYGVTVDLVLKNAAGAEIFRKDKYVALDTLTRTRRRDVFVTGSVGISGLVPGAYTLELLCRDINSDKAMVVPLPFSVTAG